MFSKCGIGARPTRAECRTRRKIPRSIDFSEEPPRPPAGTLYKRILRDARWGDRKSRIV